MLRRAEPTELDVTSLTVQERPSKGAIPSGSEAPRGLVLHTGLLYARRELHKQNYVSGVPMSSAPNEGYKFIDLFAGCGGMTQGFVNEGFRPSLAVEWDLAAWATYAANFGEGHTVWGDIAALPDDSVPEVDVVLGGPPCQGFSNLGSRDPDDPRNKLWREYVRIVSHARPKVFVIENVDRSEPLTSSDCYEKRSIQESCRTTPST